MYTITLEINQICNMRCSYCYLGEKDNSHMSLSVAKKALHIAFLNVERHRDRKLWVDFVGGEALLSFGFLQELVIYINREILKRNIKVTYSITTNGSIMNEVILEWLIKNRVQLKVSIDGNRKTHDRNRKLITGEGSYESILRNREYFKIYEERAKLYIQVANVITQNNYKETFQSIKHLVEELKFTVIDSSWDVTDKWGSYMLDELAQEWEKVLVYYIANASAKKFFWIPILDLQKYAGEKRKVNFCGVGLIQIYIKNSGKIYGCAANLNESGCLGDVEKGFSVEKIQKYRDIFTNQGLCISCENNKFCQSKNCVMNSLAYSETLEKHNPDMCYFEMKKQALWQKYGTEISITCQ